MLFVIAVTIFAAVAIAVWGVFHTRENVLSRRVRPASPAQMVKDRSLEGNLAQRVVAPLVSKIGRLLARTFPQNAVRRLDQMLVMAGEPMSTPVYLTFWTALALFGGLILSFIALSRPDISPLQLLGIGVPLLGLSAGGPYLILNRRVRSRQRSIIRALPDALDLLVTCMEAGLGVDAAFAKVTEKTSGLLSEAFSLYLKQAGLGRSRRDALTYVAERTGVKELVRLASAVTQGESVGASLGGVLRTQAADLRLLRRQRAQQTAQRAPVLMTIPLVLCFLPAMGIVIMAPSILSLMRFIGSVGPG
ncbi:MAG TPA: type II secretion system F family protein [Dehalococcoidia bacterium]|nr:type II secretion system F family protein [Dehalococcoidia bacterium]